MIKSMTGFGKSEFSNASYNITVEVRTLNSKFLDLNLRMPQAVRNREFLVRTMLQDKLQRGKADCSIQVEFNQAQSTTSINRAMAKQYYTELKSIAEELGEPSFNALATALKMPDVVETERNVNDEPLWLDVKNVLEKALVELESFRKQEGDKLRDELEALVHKIQALAEEAVAMDSNRSVVLRERLHQLFIESGLEEKMDTGRFEQEVIYYLERLDFTEEKVRLLAHCDYFLLTINDAQSNGRKLGFISQEMGREINTMGAKAHDVGIQRRVVMMKDELEKIKEQLMNVL
ncbi:MAG TPA: YicC/YloC family endoribonuclease [Chitinophagales bacterium]|nr:YicC/YloC family endoribonuclease [Chitinophagales bacterium]